MSKKKHRCANATVRLQELAIRKRFKYTFHSQEYYITLPKRGVLTEMVEREVAKVEMLRLSSTQFMMYPVRRRVVQSSTENAQSQPVFSL
jgi:hypothetical protein